MALDSIGKHSLQAVNQWVNVINANLQGSSRTGFKTSRVSFSDGLGLAPIEAGVTTLPATLTVQATTIEWGQGSVINTDSNTDFALQGEGFFVVSDDAGRFYATRDGEFHWSGEGYLVNSAGLKVLSAGQDFIRYHHEDKSDVFNIDGESNELDYYGDKSFMVVDFENLQGLRMSKYSSTIFEIPGNIPLRLQNDFSNTTDGLSYIDDDPLFQPFVDDPGFVPGGFSIDFGSNGIMNFAGFNSAATTIQDVVNAINAVPGGNVQAFYDTDRDRLAIVNDVSASPTPDNRIVFDGPNGLALRKFFDLGSNRGDNGTGAINSMESYSDIDNSDGYAPLDITPGLVAVPLDNLTQPRDAGFEHVKVTDPLQGFQTGGTVISDARTLFAPLPRASHLVIGESQKTGEFDVGLQFRLSSTVDGAADPGGNSTFTFSFGQDDAHSIASGGFELQFNGANVQLLQRSTDPNSPSIPVGAPVALPMATTNFVTTTVPPSPAAAAQAINNLRVRLDAKTRILNIDLNGASIAFNLIGDRDLFGGHISAGNRNGILEMHSLEADFKARYNTERNGMLVSVGPTDVSKVDEKNPWQSTGRTRVIQSAKETSNASLTEYVPMLAAAQKVFSAISKIISTHINVVDDMNSLIR